jgi:stage II sporulation protein D
MNLMILIRITGRLATRFDAKKIDGTHILCLYHQVLKPLFIRILLTGLLLGSLQFVGAHNESDAAMPVETIRVAILKNAASVTVEGDGIIAIRENGSAVAFTTPVVVKPGRNAVIVDGTSYRRLTFAGSSAVYVNGKPYRGAVEASSAEKGVLVVNELPLEDYLVGLINCEISSAWPMEAVKAQAVIARTYALNRKQSRSASVYHLESSIIDQVYDGCEIEDNRARRGVSDTAGEVLSYRGDIIQAFYHSNCGGRTEASEHVWGKPLPYLAGVDCRYCLTTPSSVWDVKIALPELEDRLKAAGYKVSGIMDIRAGSRNSRGRLSTVQVVALRGEATLTGDQFRKAVGYTVIKSTNFSVKVENGQAGFSGLGNGHGVGLCQWGAKQRALDGFGYNEILSYYYPGTDLLKLSDIR